jgi:hypothetical protein
VASQFTLALRYTVTENGNRRDVSQTVNLPRTDCPYGGTRPWFACPCCSRRVALMYLRWGRFACRKCQLVAHASQSEDFLDRLWRKQSKIEARLAEHWRRPKGMRRRTYEPLFEQLLLCEELREQAFEALTVRLLASL